MERRGKWTERQVCVKMEIASCVNRKLLLRFGVRDVGLSSCILLEFNKKNQHSEDTNGNTALLTGEVLTDFLCGIYVCWAVEVGRIR